MIKGLIFTIFLVILVSTIDPVVIFHGLGDQCSNSGMNSFTQQVANQLNTYTVCIQIGNGAMSSVFKPFNAQAIQACEKINADQNLRGNISVVGLSQGALLARSIIQSCEFKGTVQRIISIGGPQMGVSKFPGCFNGIFCNILNLAVTQEVYSGLVQNKVGPAGYFHDYKHENKFIAKSHFLSELNNQKSRDEIKFAKLKNTKMMLVMFNQDSVVYPKQSEWFEYFDSNGELADFFHTDVYTQNLLPLKEMNQNRQISFIKIEGDHLRFTMQDVKDIFVPFLKDEYTIEQRLQ